MKSVLVLSLASSTLAVPFGSLLDAIFVKREIPERRHQVPGPEMLSSRSLSWAYNDGYDKGDLQNYPTGLSKSRHYPSGTGTRYTRTATNAYPTASGGAEFSILPWPPGPVQSSLALSVTYGLAPTSTPVEAPEVSTPPAQPEVPVVTPPAVTPPVVSISTPPAIPEVPVVTPPIVTPPVATPSANPGIPSPGSPGNPTPGQPGIPICGQPGLEYCGTGTYPSATPVDPWASHAGPNITPGPGTGYPTGTGYPGTGIYGPPSTLTTWTRTATPTPADESDYGGGEDAEDRYGSEKRGFWRRLEDEVKEALGFGGGRSEMSS